MLTEKEKSIILQQQKEARRKKEDEIAMQEIRKCFTKFGKLEPGEKFMFPCAMADGMMGITIYLKLEYSVYMFGYAPAENLKPQTAVSLHDGSFIGPEEDTEVLKIQSC